MAAKKTTTKPENEQPYMSDGEAEAIAIKAREQEEAERLAKQRADGDDPDHDPQLELEQERDKLRAELNEATQAFEACVMERDSALKAEEDALLKRDAERERRRVANEQCSVAMQGLDAAWELLAPVLGMAKTLKTLMMPPGWVEGVEIWKQAYEGVMNPEGLKIGEAAELTASIRAEQSIARPPVGPGAPNFLPSGKTPMVDSERAAPGMAHVPGFVQQHLPGATPTGRAHAGVGATKARPAPKLATPPKLATNTRPADAAPGMAHVPGFVKQHLGKGVL